MATQAAADEVLFFIPDLGGFTKFIAETEVQHSQHIIQELLERLVDSNTLGMKVSEFEGDAVLFYRTGAPPSLEQLVQQARKMYLDFHATLKKFEYARVCQCGACAGARGISLKMVAHFGSAGTMQVKDHVKLIGKDIIIAHRLLKNSVSVPEYLLVTQPTLSKVAAGKGELMAFADGADAYDNLGTIEYGFKSLDGYLGEVKVDPPLPAGLKNPRKMAQLTRTINAPIEQVYQRLIDLPGRIDWIEGATRVEESDDHPNYIGKTHRCVRGEEGVELMTTEVKISNDTMELWETDLKKMSACRYLLTRTPDGKADVALELYVRDNPIVRTIFRLLMEKKLTVFFEKSLANLAKLCEEAER
jgi:hypothetical protein